MSLLESMFRGIRGGLSAAANPNDERYWSAASGPVYLSGTGGYVTPELALQVGALFQGIRIIAESIGTLPRRLYREREDGGRDLAKDHALWPLVRRSANAWQTTEQWVETMIAQAILWGIGCSEIKRGRRGYADQLVPLMPGNYTIEQLTDYRLRFRIHEPGKPERVLLQDEVFRLEGICILGLVPVQLLDIARNTIGLWLAMEKFNTNFFAQGARPSLAIQKLNVKLDAEARSKAIAEFQQNYGGVGNMHKVMFVDKGGEVKEFGFSARDAQMIEARDKQGLQVGTYLNLPEHMLRSGVSPKYGKKEEANQELVDFTLRPWAVRFESAFRRDLIEDDDVFLKFNFDALLRGNTLDRYQAHAIGIMNGFESENEVRAMEDRNPIKGLDEPRRSVNQDRGAEPRTGDAGPRRPSPPPAADADDDDATLTAPTVDATAAPPAVDDIGAHAPHRHHLRITEAAARRVATKEAARFRDLAVKLVGKADAWRAAVADFYDQHAALVAESLQLPPAAARRYCDAQRDTLLAAGAAALDHWTTTATQILTDLALEEIADARQAA